MMQSDTMMQGDAFSQEIKILKNDEVVTPDDVADVEITIGGLSKTYASGKVKYVGGVWMFPMSQKETFRFAATRLSVQVRVCWPTGEVEGIELGEIFVTESASRKVLGGD